MLQETVSAVKEKFTEPVQMRMNSFQEQRKVSDKQNWQDYIVRTQRMQERLKKESLERVERRKYDANERKNKFNEKQMRLVQLRKDNEGKRRELERKNKVLD